MELFVIELTSDEVEEETQMILMNFLQQMAQSDQGQLQQVFASLQSSGQVDGSALEELKNSL